MSMKMLFDIPEGRKILNSTLKREILNQDVQMVVARWVMSEGFLPAIFAGKRADRPRRGQGEGQRKG